MATSSNENSNGLVRQYFPKCKGVAMYTQVQHDEIANKLNTKPQKKLGFKTPAKVLDEALHCPHQCAPFNRCDDYQSMSCGRMEMVVLK